MSRAATRVAELLATAPARTGTTKVLAIDGPSGAGKTTLAAAVRDLLQANTPTPEIPIVSMDSIYPGWDGLAASVPRLVKGVLQPLATGGPIGYRRYDWENNRDADWVEVRADPRPPVLIVEGAGAGSLPCAPFLALLVWLDAPVDLRFDRAMTRDGEGYRPHWQRWADQEVRHFAEHDPRGRADLRLDTQDSGVT
jgi:hypothetical protein